MNNTDRSHQIHQILEDVYGYSSFRYEQEKIILSLLDGKDVLAIMPTGGGKSLCFQIPALSLEGLAIVISPLIALMDDQVNALLQLGVKAAALHSNVEYTARKEILQSIEDKSLKLLYVSPEKLQSPDFLNYLRNLQISLFAIDEAHCVSVWGNDFRPDYVQLRIIKEAFPAIPIIALTATADHATQKDIVKQLRIPEAEVYLASFERTNISVECRPGQKRIEQILDWVQNRKGESGIIYCLSKKNTEKLAERLKDRGYRAAYYHAGMDGLERTQIQRRFTDDEIDIVCATIAFGMGIDKPNIRYVIHYSMPKNIEGYYQEIGRAGRDGDQAEALLFYSWGDYLILQKFIEESDSDDTFKNVQKAKLERIWQYANAQNCRTNFVLSYFGEFKNDPCGHCDNCLYPPQIIDGTKYTQMALSAITRAKESVSVNLLVDVLRGSFKKEVTQLGLDKIKTFGVGRIVPYAHWRHYITQMINSGIIQIDFSDYSKLKLTPLSHAVLQGEQMVELAEYRVQENKAKEKVKKATLEIDEYDEGLYERLRQWRSSLARERNVPAYIILSDKSLKHIASIKPVNEQDLLRAHGIGKNKLENFGEAIINIVLNKA